MAPIIERPELINSTSVGDPLAWQVRKRSAKGSSMAVTGLQIRHSAPLNLRHPSFGREIHKYKVGKHRWARAGFQRVMRFTVKLSYVCCKILQNFLFLKLSAQLIAWPPVSLPVFKNFGEEFS